MKLTLCFFLDSAASAAPESCLGCQNSLFNAEETEALTNTIFLKIAIK
jgi:hypothetical protein